MFLTEDEVWKVKKPVSLGFLDFSTPAARGVACEAEVRLNRRLAPHVYLGVVPITLDERGRHQIGGGGPPVDWAVHMRRLPDEDRVDVRLAQGRLTASDVELIAQRLVSFHEEAKSDEETARYGTPASIRLNVRENFAQARETISAYLTPAQGSEIQGWQERFLEENEALFEERIRSGRVRDGHGDLRSEHIYLDPDGRVRILDCIEFNERFRYADVCADVAFLSMDLAWRERVDLAERFLAAYSRESNDYDLYPMVDFYESYRAYVRGKIASMRITDRGAGRTASARSIKEARRYYLLALSAERRPLVPPVVVAVGGVVAVGKTTIADRLSMEMAAPVVSSDRARKFLHGVGPTRSLEAAPWEGAYATDRTEQVYEELIRRGSAVLTSGRPLVLDASFRSRQQRGVARRLAREHQVPFRFVECRAPAELCRTRLLRRSRRPEISDARLSLFDEFSASWEPAEELGESEHIVLDTSEAVETSLALLRSNLAMWPATGREYQ